MNKFNCEFCNYTTNKKSSWTKHLSSKKHNINKNKVIDEESSDSEDFLEADSKVACASTEPERADVVAPKEAIENKQNTKKVADQNDRNIAIKHHENVKKCIKNLDQKQGNSTVCVTQEDCSFKCRYCDKIFTLKSSLTRHINHRCLAKARADNDLEWQKEIYKQLLDREREITKDKSNQINYLASELKDARYQTKDQMSLFKTLITMYKDNLPCQTMHCQVTADFQHRYMEVHEMLNDLTVPPTAVTVEIKMDDLFYYKDHKNLDTFIGQKLVDEYKKKDPKSQAIWSSDVARLVFIIRVQTESEVIWFKDKGGNKTKELIVDSILKEIDEALNFYINYVDTHKHEFEPKKLLNYVYNQMKAVEIQDDIIHGELAKGIMKYIAPCFTFQNQLTN